MSTFPQLAEAIVVSASTNCVPIRKLVDFALARNQVLFRPLSPTYLCLFEIATSHSLVFPLVASLSEVIHRSSTFSPRYLVQEVIRGGEHLCFCMSFFLHCKLNQEFRLGKATNSLSWSAWYGVSLFEASQVVYQCLMN